MFILLQNTNFKRHSGSGFLRGGNFQTITKDESQGQALLQLVQEHRIQHPGQSKSNFLNMNSVLLQI